MREEAMICWNCGKRKATQEQYGYPVCDECAEEGIDPEEMEMVVIESLEKGEVVPLNSIDEEKYK